MHGAQHDLLLLLVRQQVFSVREEPVDVALQVREVDGRALPSVLEPLDDDREAGAHVSRL